MKTKAANLADRFVIIMAGGKGERFWPVSREKTPKQLITLLGGRGQAIITIGIKPTEPATGYGYIRVGEALPPPQGVKSYKTVFHRAEQFVEKPRLDKALEYLSSGQYRWNAGMFIWSFVTITEGLQKHQPEMYEACQRWFKVAAN